MNILITGSDGFLGKYLINELNKYIDMNIISYDITTGCDILDKDNIEKNIINYNINVIIHLAAISNLNVYNDNTDIGNNVNVMGTKNILSLCVKYNIKLLFASTCCIYGNNIESINSNISDETSSTATEEPYALSKLISEQDILKVGFPNTCMRFATFYGPNMRKELSPAIFLDKCYKGEEILIHGTGNQTRTFTYITDIVDGIITILLSNKYYGIINITNTEQISVLDMIHIVEEITGKKAIIKHIKDRSHQIYKEYISNDRLCGMNWKPKVSFFEGMKLSYQSYINSNSTSTSTSTHSL